MSKNGFEDRPIERQPKDTVRNRDALFETLIENILDVITIVDNDGIIRYQNTSIEQMLGFNQAELIGMNIFDLIHPDDVPMVLDAYGEMKAELDAGMRIANRVVAARIRHKDDTWHNLESMVASFDFPHVAGFVVASHDITERRRMERELLRLAAAIEQAGEGVMIFTPEEIIEYVNPTYERLYGYSRQELIGSTIMVLGEDVYEAYREIFDRIRLEGKPWTGRRTIKRKNGDIIVANMNVSPVYDQTGSITNLISLSQDVTYETRLQRIISENQKMEALGTLAGGVSHDLKNILAPILINTEIALEDVGAGHPARPVLEETLHAAHMGIDIVGQIATFSRREPQVKIPIDISYALKGFLRFLRSAIPSTIEIQDQIDAAGAHVMADPTRINQVLINLGTNAAYAMKGANGILEVKFDKVELDDRAALLIDPDLSPGPYVRLTVQDTGTGIEDKVAKHIFEPFFTTKGSGEGSGMGLALVHGIVKDHQGAVTVRSKPGEGTTFTVYLPMMKQG